MTPKAIKVTVSVTTDDGEKQLLDLTHDFGDGRTAMYLHTNTSDQKGTAALMLAENALGSALSDVKKAIENAPGIQRYAPIPEREWNGKFDA